jgi:hypothetical protein
VVAARTSGRGVAGVVGQVRGTDVELEVVKAGADPIGGEPSAWRRSGSTHWRRRQESEAPAMVALHTTKWRAGMASRRS